jgi:hypothetical protein
MPNEVTFDDLTNPAITVQAPRYPEEPGRDYPQIVGLTSSGSHIVADLGDGSTVHLDMVLHFRNFPDADMTTLRTFIETTVDWAKTLFTYTDPHSVAHTNMRYMGGLPENRATLGDFWNFDMRLSKDMDP